MLHSNWFQECKQFHHQTIASSSASNKLTAQTNLKAVTHNNERSTKIVNSAFKIECIVSLYLAKDLEAEARILDKANHDCLHQLNGIMHAKEENNWMALLQFVPIPLNDLQLYEDVATVAKQNSCNTNLIYMKKRSTVQLLLLKTETVITNRPSKLRIYIIYQELVAELTV